MIKKTGLDLTDLLTRKIYAYAQSIWKEKWTNGIDEVWLNNFECIDADLQERERVNMLYLLSRFMYFGNTEVRHLLVSVYRDLYKYPIVEKIRKDNNDTTDIAFINAEFEKERRATRFLGVGNPSESGVHLLYYFRQECNLSKENFMNASEIFTPRTILSSFGSLRPLCEWLGIQNWPRNRTYIQLTDRSIKRYVFIDDLCGSGTQASIYLRPIVDSVKKSNPNAVVSYFMLFGTKTGIERIQGLRLFDSVDAVFTIDTSFKAFSSDSRYFADLSHFASEHAAQLDKDFSKTTAEKYGLPLFDPALGYGDGQLLLGLFHNTPDNTLPIFWSEENGWEPVFKRYHKIY